MAPRKRVINGATSKDKAIGTAEGMVPPLTDEQSHTTKDTGSSSPQGATTCAQLPQRHEDQFLQMLTEMKEQMKEQQAQLDRDREQAALNCENAISEQEALR